MKHIRIKNQGLISPQAIHLLGASTKRNDQSKIGQFGSGNKYALAYFLRNGYDLKIYAGLEEIAITTKEEIFRDQSFEVIYVNGEKTSITLGMGVEWKFWQAIRELYCNAIDEGGHSIDLVQDIELKEGETHFYFDVKQEVAEFITNFDNYFSTRPNRVLFECPAGKILKKSGQKANVYRRGVRCYETDLLSAYDYDFNDLHIDENRLASHWWQIGEKIWDLVLKCDNKEIILNVLNNSADEGFIEGGLWEYSSIHTHDMSETFKEVMKTTRMAPKAYAGLLKPDEIHNHVIIPHVIYKALQTHIPEENKGDRFRTTIQGAMFRIMEANDLQLATIKQAMDFLKECNLDIPYEIKVALFDEKNINGAAFNGMILLSETGLNRGVGSVVNTIIEEYIHLKYDVADATRGFQTSIITEFVAYMQKVNSYVI